MWYLLSNLCDMFLSVQVMEIGRLAPTPCWALQKGDLLCGDGRCTSYKFCPNKHHVHLCRLSRWSAVFVLDEKFRPTKTKPSLDRKQKERERRSQYPHTCPGCHQEFVATVDASSSLLLLLIHTSQQTHLENLLKALPPRFSCSYTLMDLFSS